MTPAATRAGLLGLLLAFALAKAPTLPLPYHWDEMGYVAPLCFFYYEHGLDPRAHVGTSGDPLLRRLSVDSGHPPLFYLVVAALWRLTGPATWVPHLLVLLSALVGIAATARLAAWVVAPEAALPAALALAAHPMYFAQAGTAHLDLPLAALATAALAALFEERLLPYLVAASLAMLLKAQAVLVQPALSLVILRQAMRRHPQAKGSVLRDVVLWHLPLVPLVAWRTWFYLDTGVLLTQNTYNTERLASWHDLLRGVIRTIYFGLAARGTIVFAAALVAGLAVAVLRRPPGAMRMAPLLVTIAVVLGVLAPLRNNGPRYFFLTLPLVIVGGLWGLSMIGLGRTARTCVLGAALLIELAGFKGADPLIRALEAVGVARATAYQEGGVYWSPGLELQISGRDVTSRLREPLDRPSGGDHEERTVDALLDGAPLDVGEPATVVERLGTEFQGQYYRFALLEGRIANVTPVAGGWRARIVAPPPPPGTFPVPHRIAHANDSHECSMQYVDVVRLHEQAFAWIRENRPGARVLANWPALFMARYPYLGYVEEALPVLYLADEVNGVQPGSFDVLYDSDDSMYPDMATTVVRRLALRPIQRFESPVGGVTLYASPPP